MRRCCDTSVILLHMACHTAKLHCPKGVQFNESTVLYWTSLVPTPTVIAYNCQTQQAKQQLMNANSTKSATGSIVPANYHNLLLVFKTSSKKAKHQKLRQLISDRYIWWSRELVDFQVESGSIYLRYTLSFLK